MTDFLPIGPTTPYTPLPGDRVVVFSHPSQWMDATFTIRDDVLVALDGGDGSRHLSQRWDPETGLSLVDGALPVPDLIRTDDDPDAPWHTQMEFLYTSGAVNYRVTLRADGVTVEESLRADGTVSLRNLYDAGDAYDWMWIMESVRPDGTIDERVERQDDLMERYVQHSDDSSWLEEVWEVDYSDLQPWAYRSEARSLGQLTELNTSMDDGVERLEAFGPGEQLVRTLKIDAYDARPWARIETLHGIGDLAPVGALRAWTRTNDDGTVQARHYEDGVHVRTGWTDPDDAHWWRAKAATYDAATGELLARSVTRDDGIETVTVFAGDVPIQVELTDHDDIRDWATRIETLEGGDFVTRSATLYDDGTRETRDYDRLHPGWFFQREIDDGGVHPWASRVSYASNAEGRIDRLEVTYDDGVETMAEWRDGLQIELQTIDAADAHDWDHTIAFFDPVTGLMVRDERNYDDGVLESLGYEGEVLTSKIAFDMDDAWDWFFREEIWDASTGALTYSLVESDDGSYTELYFADGLRVSVVVSDPSGAEGWAWLSEDYVEGVLVERVTERVDGTERIEAFAPDGTPASRFDIDVPDLHPWQVKRAWFDAEGRLGERQIVSDDGVEQVRHHDAGRHVSTAWTDHDDARDWSFRFVTYAADGTIASKTRVKDDGTVKTVDLDGPRRVVTIEDGAGIRDWAVREKVFDVESGAMLLRTVTGDDGVVVGEAFRDGLRVARTREDTGDQFDWTRTQKLFDAAGDVAAEVVLADDGLQWTRTYVDGVLSTEFTVDHGDLFDWHAQLRTYDDAGQLTGFEEMSDAQHRDQEGGFLLPVPRGAAGFGFDDLADLTGGSRYDPGEALAVWEDASGWH